MACVDIQTRVLPSGNGDRIITWLVTPRVPKVRAPFDEQDGWFAIGKIGDLFYYNAVAPGAGLKP